MANDKAIELLERLIQVDAKDAGAHADLAAAYAASGDRERAAKQFETALQLAPRHASALMKDAGTPQAKAVRSVLFARALERNNYFEGAATAYISAAADK